MYKPTPIAVGIDLSDRLAHICIIGEDAEVTHRAKVQATPEGLRGFFAQRPRLEIAIETGPHARWVQRELVAMGHGVLTADARRLRSIYENENKDDEVDAEMLARLRRVDPKLLHPVGRRSEEDWQALALLRARDRLVGARTKLINAVRGMVKSTGTRVSSCDAQYFHRRREEVPDDLRYVLEPLFECIEYLTVRIERMEKMATKVADERYADTQLLRQIPGIGTLTSLGFVAAVGDPHRFSNSRKVGSYFGLRSGKDQSGASDPKLPITKCGDRYVRRLLVGAAQYMLGPFGKPCAIRDWGLELAARGGRAARKKAAVAVARKLAVVMHTMMVKQVDWDPYPNGEPTLRMVQVQK